MAKAYFGNFPSILYTLDDAASYKRVKDLLRRVIIRESVKTNGSLYVEYQVQDGDTAEIIANKLYGDSNYHWIVYLMNDIINPFYDMPLSSRHLEKYIYDKYRGSALFLKDIASSGITSITKTDYENMTTPQLENLNIAGNQQSVSVPENVQIIVDNKLVNVVEWDRTLRKLAIDSDDMEDYQLHVGLSASDEKPIRLSSVYVLGTGQDSAGDSAQEITSSNDISLALYTDSINETIVTTAEAKVLNYAALHHFEDSTGYLWTDPLTNSRLEGYINSLSGSTQEPDGVVVNELHEEAINNDKLNIKLLLPKFVDLAVSEIQEAF